MLQPYIESATALSNYVDDKEPQEFPAEMDFQQLAGPRNVSVDLNYDILCLCMAYLLEMEEVTA